MRFAINKERMLPHQRKFWELPNFIKLMIGGFGSGKTRIGALRSIWFSYLNAPLPTLYVSPSYKQARRTVVVSIAGLLDASRIRYLYNKTNHEFYIPGWKGTIWIGSGDDPNSLKGPNLATAGIDEPFLIDEDILPVILSRLRVKEAKATELFLTGTPEELNWGYELAQNVDKRYDLGIVVGKTQDNIHLASNYVSMLEKAFDDNQRAAFMDGKFVNLKKGRVYKYFDDKTMVQELVVGQQTVKAGIDFNVDHLTAELFFEYGDGRIHFFGEIQLSNATTYELADLLHEKYPGIIVFPDPAGRSRKTSANETDFTILREKGFTVEARNAHPPVRARVNAVNKLMREGKLTCSSDCRHLINDFEQVTWKNGDIDKSNEALTHASDAAGYALEKLYPVRLPDRNYKQPQHWRV